MEEDFSLYGGQQELHGEEFPQRTGGHCVCGLKGCTSVGEDICSR